MILKLKFPAGAWTDYSDLLIDRSVEITRKLMNDERRSVVDTCSFQLKYDQALQVALFSANDWIEFDLDDDDSNDLFTGVIAPNYGLRKKQNVMPISFEAVDMSYRLDEQINTSFNYPATIGGTEYAIFDADNSASNVVWELLEDAGYTPASDIASGAPDISTTVEYFQGTEGEETYREYLDTLLSEYGYVFYFNASGEFSVYQWDKDTVTDTFTIDEDIEIRHRDQPYDGFEVEFAQTETDSNALLYRDNLPVSQTNGEWAFTGQAIADDDYYPPDGDIDDIYQNYSIKWLDKPFLSRDTRLKNKDITLIAADASDSTVSFTADSGIAISSSTYEAKRAKVLFRNTSGDTAKIYNFEIKGTALYRKYRRFTKAPDTATNPKKYVSRFIFDNTLSTTQAHATRFARAMNGVIQNGEYIYTWDERTERNEGDIGNVNMTNPSIDKDVVIIEKRWNPQQSFYTYTAQGISAYSASVDVASRGETGGTTPTEDQIAIDNAINFPSDSLVAYYSFDDGSAIDTSGNGNHGTVSGAVAAAGKSRNALSFDGSNDYVSLPSGVYSAIDHATGFSVSLWAKLDTLTQPDSDAWLFEVEQDNSNEFVIYYRGASQDIRIQLEDSTSTVNLNAGGGNLDWTHIVVTFDSVSGLISIYRNGAVVDTGTYSGSAITPVRGYIGGSGTLVSFDGLMDEVRIYSRALTATEVASLFRFPGGVEPGVVPGDFIQDASIIADKIAANAITAGKIAAGAVTATEIDVVDLAAINAVIGFDGTGTPSSPDEGDRRLYADGDELLYQRYESSAWVTYGQLSYDGANSSGKLTVGRIIFDALVGNSGSGIAADTITADQILSIDPYLTSAPTTSTSGSPGDIIAIRTDASFPTDQSARFYVCYRAVAPPGTYYWREIATNGNNASFATLTATSTLNANGNVDIDGYILPRTAVAGSQSISTTWTIPRGAYVFAASDSGFRIETASGSWPTNLSSYAQGLQFGDAANTRINNQTGTSPNTIYYERF